MMSKEIKITDGMKALVDDEDFDRLVKYNWNAHYGGRRCYAIRFSHMVDGKGVYVLMHREILSPDGDVDHINGNGLDNRRSNLRAATRSQNSMNQRPRPDGRSKYKGVCWHKQHKKWRAYISMNYKQKHVGLYTTQLEAALAYDRAALELFGEFARPNFLVNAQRTQHA